MQSTRSLLVAQRTSPPAILHVVPDSARDTWHLAATAVADLVRRAWEDLPADRAQALARVGEVGRDDDLAVLAAHQRDLAELARDLEGELREAGNLAAAAALTTWREPYTDMVTALAALRVAQRSR